MQPYLFPYVGYFHLIQAVDCFVVLDDVRMPSPGFVSRNRLLVGGEPKWFSLPVKRDHRGAPLSSRSYLLDERWVKNTSLTLRHNYSDSNRLDAEELIMRLHPDRQMSPNVVDVNLDALSATLQSLDIRPPTMLRSSQIASPAPNPTARLIRICQELGADTYVNLPGGRALYDRATFAASEIRLGFIDSRPEPYPQRAESFVPWLSILDLIANTDNPIRNDVLSAYSIDFGVPVN